MARRSKEAPENGQNGSVNPVTTPRALAIGERGIETSRDFANMMSALMSDLIEGRVKPGVANSICNAGGKLLKMLELQQKYGKREQDKVNVLTLAG